MSGMYWYAVAASDDVAGLKNKGFCVTDDGEILYNEQYEYALARMYTSDGHGIVDVETSNFFFDKDASDRITINAENPMTAPILSYKLRMTDQYPDAEWLYFAADKSEEILEDGVPHQLYKADGTPATKTDYADCEFEALNPMPSEEVGMYGRFTTATFSFATYQSTADVLHVEFTGLHQEEEEYCFADRLRVVVTAPTAPTIPFGGVLTSTSDSVIRVPVEQAGGSVAVGGYAYPDGALLDMSWNFGGVVEEYSPAPVLPTVSTTWLVITAGYGNMNIPANGEHVGYWWDDDSQSYISAVWDSDVTYGMIAFYTTPFAHAGRMELEIKEVSGTVGVHNVSSLTVTVAQANIAVCSSSSATVITVYDNSNNPYNAFKYTSDGTDYYYVLDGTQTDWTDDLASIGYRVPPPAPTIITLYMVPDRYRYVQPNVINTSSPNSSYCYQMYTSESVQDDSTKFIPDPTKDYINGYYSLQTGEWVDSSAKYNVSQMPASTGGDQVELRQVLENGKLWLGTNKTSYWYTSLNTVSFRVADKP